MLTYIPDVLLSPYAVLALAWLAFGRYVMIAIYTVKVNLSKDIRIRDKKITKQQTYRELLSSWHYPFDALVFIGMIYMGMFSFAKTNALSIISTFLFIFIWAEISYYWLHRLMHKYDFLWTFHELHHKSVTLQPLTAGSFSLVEHLGLHTVTWLIPAAIISKYIPISFYGIILFYVYYYFMTSVAHANIELSPSWIRAIPIIGKIASTSTGHALHHSLYSCNYGFSTNLLDRVNGTYSPKTDEMLEKVKGCKKGINKATIPRFQPAYKKSQYLNDYQDSL